VSLERIGNARDRTGDTAGALATYEEGLQIARALVARDSDNTKWQRDLSVSLNKIGDMRHRAGDVAGAFAAYDEGLEIKRKLVAIDPGNAGWRRGLIASLWKLARFPAHRISWADVVKAMAVMEADGVLAPDDRKILERARANAAREKTK
jgi:hypothetical protein